MAMSGPQHAKTANDLLLEAERSRDKSERADLFANAQLHATLAVLAALVHGGNMAENDIRQWQNIGRVSP